MRWRILHFGVRVQLTRTNDAGSAVGYWLWRFDRTDDPVPLDNFWLKTPQQSLQDLREANNPTVGRPESPSDVEFAVDPYFPKTAPTVAADLKGIAVHRGLPLARSQAFAAVGSAAKACIQKRVQPMMQLLHLAEWIPTS